MMPLNREVETTVVEDEQSKKDVLPPNDKAHFLDLKYVVGK